MNAPWRKAAFICLGVMMFGCSTKDVTRTQTDECEANEAKLEGVNGISLTLNEKLKELDSVLGTHNAVSLHPVIRNRIQVQWLSGAVTADFVGQNLLSDESTPIRIVVSQPSQGCTTNHGVRLFLSGITLRFSGEQAVRRLMRDGFVSTTDVAATARSVEEGLTKLSIGHDWSIGWRSHIERGDWIDRIEVEDTRYSTQSVN
jgi:hypothetical protein